MLNEAQAQVVNFGEGVLQVLAGAGSGKTRSMVERIVSLVARGIEPDTILSLCFNRKAADELSERIAEAMGAEVAKKVWARTFHSLGYLITIEYARDYGFRSRPQVIGARQSWMLDKALEDSDLDPTLFKGALVNGLKYAKAHDMDCDEYYAWLEENERSPEEKSVVRAMRRYESAKRDECLIDFDDMIFYARRTLRRNALARAKWQGQFDYVLVDEFQDVDEAQFEIVKILSQPENNLTVVGDDFQCIVAGSLVSTPDGDIPIEHVGVGQGIFAMNNGMRVESVVTNKSYTTDVRHLRISTESGKILNVTENHTLFARMTDPEGWYLYLMYREDKGFRLGITQARSLRWVHILTRASQEGAERMWLLRQYDDKSAAAADEVSLSLQYQVPTLPFNTKGRSLAVSQEDADGIFDLFRVNGNGVLKAFSQDFDRPIHMSQATTRGGKQTVRVNLIMGGSKGSTVNVETTDAIAGSALYELSWTDAKKGKRIRRVFKDFVKARDYANDVAGALEGAVVVEKACHPSINLMCVPAAAVLVGMKVPVAFEDSVLLDRVVKVEVVNQQVECYDIQVRDYANFCVDGVYVHNSIYAFRGADPSFTINFKNHYPDAEQVFLVRNYRSTIPIIETSNRLIAHNENQVKKELISTTESDDFICGTVHSDAVSEGIHVASDISSLIALGAEPQDFAVLYRTNAQAAFVETALMRAAVPYVVQGGFSFYGRKEVKDVTAYLSLALNGDNASFERIFNRPNRFLGKAFLTTLTKVAAKDTLLSTCRRLGTYGKLFKPYAQKSVAGLLAILRGIELTVERAENVGEVLEYIVKTVDYETYLKKDLDENEPDNDVMANLLALYEVAAEFTDARSFVEFISGMQDAGSKKADEKPNAVTLSTLHRSKGLEWNSVYMIGVSEGLLPHRMAEDVEEERRLCYVGLTRGRLTVRVSSLRSYNGKEMGVSRFITEAEIPVEDIEEGDDE